MAMQSGFIKRIRDIMRMDAGINGDAQRIEQMVWMLFLKVYDAKEDDWEIKEAIFLYIRGYYRAFMKELNPDIYPQFSIKDKIVVSQLEDGCTDNY